MSHNRDGDADTFKSYLLDIVETEQLQRERIEQNEIDSQIGQQEEQSPQCEE